MRAPKAPYTWTATGAGAGLIHFNPCGKVVANLRHSYTTECRFFRDSDLTVQIKWVPAQPGAEVMDLVTPFSSLRWKAFPWLQRGVGEVFGAPVTIHRPVAIPGADGRKHCGALTDFQLGGYYRPDLPDTQYTPEGLALCCGPDPGGVALGGEWVDPPTVDAGPTCATAALIYFGVQYTSPEEVWPSPYTGYRWFVAGPCDGSTRRIRVSPTNPALPPGGGTYLRGASCGALLGIGSWVGETIDITAAVPLGEFLYVLVFSAVVSPPAVGPGFTIQVD